MQTNITSNLQAIQAHKGKCKAKQHKVMTTMQQTKCNRQNRG